MPHIVVKLYSGRTPQQKARIAEALTKAIMASDGCAERSVSVAIEDVEPDEWAAKVYDPEIKANWDTLYKKPGYTP